MFRPCFAIAFLLVSITLGSLSVGRGEEPRLVAGRTIDDYASQLHDDDRVVRLRAVRSFAPFGAAAGDVLIESLDHEDAAVRYIAAVQLGHLGGDPLKRAVARLRELADDEASLAVGLAASYALCRSGKIDQHLATLIKALDYPERGMACNAAELIGDVGPSAAAAIKPLEAAYEQHRPGAKGGDYHIGGAVMNALRKVRSEQN